MTSFCLFYSLLSSLSRSDPSHCHSPPSASCHLKLRLTYAPGHEVLADVEKEEETLDCRRECLVAGEGRQRQQLLSDQVHNMHRHSLRDGRRFEGVIEVGCFRYPVAHIDVGVSKPTLSCISDNFIF